MSIVIYTKKGKRSYKENRLIDKIKPIIEKQLDENPELYGKFRPATNFDELQKLHDMYTSDDVDFEEIDENDNNKNMAKGKNDFEETSDEENLTDSLGLDDDDDDDGYNDFVDPFNREEPIVRDYVTDGVSMEPGGDVKNTGQNEFQEPTSFDEAFELDTDGDQLTEKTRSNQSQGKQQQEQRRERPQRAERSEPLNPNFDDMSSGKKKRSTKKFAKYIVETTCMLSEKGFVWYANKEINDSKLTEYELSGEMDLSLLVTLEDGQEVTVKQFFQVQCLKAEQLAVIDKEEKEDLAEALAEVLMEKGVGPTPTQELMLIAFKIFGGQAITLMTLKSQSNALLSQLRAMKTGEVQEEQREPEQYERQQYAQPTPVYEPEEVEPIAETESFDNLKSNTDEDEDEDDVIALLERQDPLLIESEIQTKE